MTHPLSWNPSQVLPWRDGLAYGLLGLPLAFAALPLYVVLPHYYASNLGLPLASVGTLLLLVRLIDAGLTDDADLARALAGLRASHAIEQTRAEILRRAEGARAQLAPLPESAAKRALGRLCDLVVTRSS